MAFDRDERRLLEDTLEAFLRDACSLEHRRSAIAAGSGFDPEIWRTLGALGALALPVPESAGGLDGSVGDVMSVTRQLGSSLALEPYLPCAVVPARLLVRCGALPQARPWLERLMAGESLYAFAHLERGSAHADAPQATLSGASEAVARLSGRKLHVSQAADLAGMIVSARDADGAVVLCLVPANAAGVRVRPYRLVDGQMAGEVTFDDVEVPRENVLREGAGAAVEDALQYAAAAAAADSVGCIDQLVQRTAQYLNDRKQFGQPIGRFQALKHRLVDCYTAFEQATALIEMADHEGAAGWPVRAAATKAFVDRHGIRIGHEAMQMHGAMGLTEELPISHFHKRILANATLYGPPDVQLDRVGALLDAAVTDRHGAALAYEELLDTTEAAFREEVQAFLAENLDESIRLAARRLTCTFAERDVTDAWHARLNARGWLAPLWPPEHGGTGWKAVERFLFEYECAIAGAPERIPMGLRYVGPIVAQFGSDSQKQFFLPKILSGEHYWAQGFSEPQAGSDLAAVKTTAVLDGDHYVVNGTKMWTTNAHVADWVFCLVRTDGSGKPQEGISFLLIDLRSPGIRVDPIKLLAGDHEVNQVFFDNVQVPRENLVGAAGRGWQYAKFLLELERGGTVACGRARAELNAVKEHAGTLDISMRRRLAELEVRLMALEAFEFRMARAMTRATEPGAGGSIVKLVASELQQDVTQFGVEVAGLAALELDASRPIEPETSGYPGRDLDLVAMPRYLNTRATTIFAGSSEIQREIIAKHILGLRG
jgi:alkylation response protein AidB-like acyl-CoA dehydrogenase